MTDATRNLLEQHFDTAFAAPDGVGRLRELILTLAMQGKLVEQDPNDSPASELLKEIEAEKQRLVKAGKIKKPKPLPPIKPEEVPFQLPQGWEWVRLNDALDVRDGTHDTPKYVDVGYPLVTSKNIYTGRLSLEDVKYISKEDHEKIAERSKVDNGDILFAMIGSIGNPVIIDSDVEFSIKNVALFKYFMDGKPSNRYLHYYLVHAQENMKAISSGAVQSFVSLGFLRNYPFPLPPFSEQHRIVARIDQLMARCDALEKLRKEREEKRLAVHAAAIKQLLDVPDGSAWDFIEQHFGELYTVKENVAELRKAILQLAVMGRLVPQDPNDPPASELLKEIEAEKQRLVKAGKIKKPKPLPPIKPEEVPYDLPLGWEWVRLQDVLDVRDGTHDSPKDAVGSDTYPLITSKNFSNGQIDFSDARMISADDHFEISKRSKVERLDILFSMIGGNIGNQVIVQDDRDFSIKNVALFKYYSRELTYPYFIKSFMEHLAADLQLKAVGGAQPFVSLGFLRNIIIGLPSVNEQHRIVARIDQLISLCDTLDQQIDDATGKQTELLNAVMAQL